MKNILIAIAGQWGLQLIFSFPFGVYQITISTHASPKKDVEIVVPTYGKAD